MSKTIRFQGIPASPGIAIAPAVVMDRKKIRVPRIPLKENGFLHEQVRFSEAVKESKKQIEKAMASLAGANNKPPLGNHALILQAHLLMLDDPIFIDSAAELIQEKMINAEWAVSIKMEETMNQLASLGDEYFQERAQDVEFVGSRILRNLLGHSTDDLPNLVAQTESVVVSVELSPAETAQMVNGPVVAFATEEGTRTSHTAIMAQALSIPAVVGVEDLTKSVSPGDSIIVDGLEGLVIINPDEKTVQRYKDKATQWSALESRLRSTKNQPSITLDKVEVTLLSNIELPAEAPLALDYGAQGIGLYRTEFLFLDREVLPTEEEQYKTYAAVLKTMSPRHVIFRTFDLGADKMPRHLQSKEKNPALGLRAVRLGLKHPELMKTQLRALIRAGKDGDAWIMFPLISGLGEFRELKALYHEALDELGLKAAPNIKIGCMIELPSAVFVADLLAKEADFFSIGTNDLIQYSMAIDRSNDHVAYLYTPFHPSVLRAIRQVIKAADDADIPVSMCGGAAGEPHMTPLLIGMGLRNLSMSPNSIPFIKAAVRTIDAADARKLADKAMEMDTAAEIEKLAVHYMQGKAGSKYDKE